MLSPITLHMDCDSSKSGGGGSSSTREYNGTSSELLIPRLSICIGAGEESPGRVTDSGLEVVTTTPLEQSCKYELDSLRGVSGGTGEAMALFTLSGRRGMSDDVEPPGITCVVCGFLLCNLAWLDRRGSPAGDGGDPSEGSTGTGLRLLGACRPWGTEGAELLGNWYLVQVTAVVTEDQILGCCCGRNQGQR